MGRPTSTSPRCGATCRRVYAPRRASARPHSVRAGSRAPPRPTVAPNAPPVGGLFAARGARKRLEERRLAAALRRRRRLWRGIPLPSSRVQHPILRCDLGAISARSRRDLSRISRPHLGRTTQAPRTGSSARRATRVSLAWRRRNGRARPRGRTSRAGCPSDARRRAQWQPRSSRDRPLGELCRRVQGPGDLILLPPQWGHATINRRFTAGIGDLYCDQRQAEMLGGEICSFEKSLIAAGAPSNAKNKLAADLFANRVDLSGDTSVKNTSRYWRHAKVGGGRPSAGRASRRGAPAVARGVASSIMQQVGLERRGRGRGARAPMIRGRGRGHSSLGRATMTTTRSSTGVRGRPSTSTS